MSSIATIILGAIISAWFLVWGLFMIIPPWVESVKSKPNGEAFGKMVNIP